MFSVLVDTTVDSGFGSQEADTPAVANDWTVQFYETNFDILSSPGCQFVLPNLSQWRTGELGLHTDRLSAERDSGEGYVWCCKCHV